MTAGVASAADKPAPAPAVAAAPAPPAPSGIPYEKFVDGATAQRGLFTIWRKDGQVAFELSPQQFHKDYVELGVPVNGIGQGLFSGLTDLQNCRLLRFERQDNRVAILMPSTVFVAKPGTPDALSVAAGTTSTVVGIAKVLSEDPKTGNVVFDASPFLQDVTDVADLLTQLNGGRALNPMGAYRQDVQQSYFGASKSFPENVVLDVDQTFSTMNPMFIDTVPDARNIAIKMQYDIGTLPEDKSYMPRIADERVGYFENGHLNFSGDDSFDKSLNYIVRWNITPGHPVTYYLSNTIPARYRAPVREALLAWNGPFARIGIPNAVVVKDQPSDPAFDPDDMRYNVVRWLSEKEGGFAEAQLLYNPSTGQMLKSGIVVDSDLMRFGKFDYPVMVEPQVADASTAIPAGSAALRRAALGAGEYVKGERANYGFGVSALAISGRLNGYNIPQQFSNEFLKSIVLHESGHDFGLRHNFIGSQAYTARQLQDPSFVRAHGVANSVMEYSPINLWPRGTRQGGYFQTAFGPYDYYAIQYGYAPIQGAASPQAELPTLRRWATAWSRPDHSYSSDEDVSWGNGMGVDPRNQQWDLTNDNIGWCQTRMKLAHDLLKNVGRRFPRAGSNYDDLQSAFGGIVAQGGTCAQIVGRYVGGEYVSRAHRGDPRAAMPISPVPIATERRAFDVLRSQLFAASAWDFNPALLRQLVTQYDFNDFSGNFAPRHDIAVEQIARRYQLSVVARMFAPVTLQRLDDMSLKYGHQTMDLADLFGWMQNAAYGDLGSSAPIPLVRRNLQRDYATTLSRLANAPLPGTPSDAQALARYELQSLHGQARQALARRGLDVMTRAHLAALDSDVERALDARAVIAQTR